MKKIKLILLLVAACTLMPLNAFALDDPEYDNDVEIDGNTYGLIYSNQTAILLNWGKKEKPSNTVTTPKSIYIDILKKEYPVTAIGNHAFSGAEMGKIVVDPCVTHIGEYAFSSCPNLYHVELPDHINTFPKGLFYNSKKFLFLITNRKDFEEVGDYAFYNTGFYDFFYDVKRVGNYAFYKCTNLEGFDTTKDGVLTEIGDYAFYGCTNLNSITMSEGLKSVGNSAFDGSGLKAVTMPNSLTSIGSAAFARLPNLTTIFFSNDYGTIQPGIFKDCKKLRVVYLGEKNQFSQNSSVSPFEGCTALERVEAPIKNPYYMSGSGGVLYSKDGTILQYYPPGKAIDKVFVISNDVEQIGNNCFFENQNLDIVVLPNNLGRIGNMAFYKSSVRALVATAPSPAFISSSFYGLKEQCYLYVPADSYGSYYNSWNYNRQNFKYMGSDGYPVGCDLNGDHEVNVTDVTHLITKILEGAQLWGNSYLDVNADNALNVSDITFTINRILGVYE